MWNFQFLKTAIFMHATGVTGYLKMDSNGDRETDFSLWDMHPETGTFRVSLWLQRMVPPGNDISCSPLPPPTALPGHLSALGHPTMLAHFWRAKDLEEQLE